MISISDHNGRAHHLALAAIARVSDSSDSGKWHGIRAYVHLFDGEVIEAREEVAHILRQIEAEERRQSAPDNTGTA